MTSWLRTEQPFTLAGPVVAERLPVATSTGWPDELRWTGMWHINSKSTEFGGYSAMVPLGGDTFRAFSDRGGTLDFTIDPATRSIGIKALRGNPANLKQMRDVESATRDPASGTIWLGLEYVNELVRLAPDGTDERAAQTEAMRGWSLNGGPESLVRLPDGRFIVLREINDEALLFPSDPAEGSEPVRFSFTPPDELDPTDAALLPDGRVLILVRRLRSWWPPFKVALLVADPATIREGEAWQWTELAELTGVLPSENYEALSVTQGASGTWHIWIMSDDNAAVLQRTLLAELTWTPDSKKGAADRPGAPLQH